MSEETLQIAEKREDAKGKRERERYTQLNADFQRIVRRYKQAFLNEQHKEVEGNNRMGKTRDLCKKTAAIQATFHAKKGTVEDRNSRDLTEAGEIKKRGQ